MPTWLSDVGTGGGCPDLGSLEVPHAGGVDILDQANGTSASGLEVTDGLCTAVTGVANVAGVRYLADFGDWQILRKDGANAAIVWQDLSGEGLRPMKIRDVGGTLWVLMTPDGQAFRVRAYRESDGSQTADFPVLDRAQAFAPLTDGTVIVGTVTGDLALYSGAGTVNGQITVNASSFMSGACQLDNYFFAVSDSGLSKIRVYQVGDNTLTERGSYDVADVQDLVAVLGAEVYLVFGDADRCARVNRTP